LADIVLLLSPALPTLCLSCRLSADCAHRPRHLGSRNRQRLLGVWP